MNSCNLEFMKASFCPICKHEHWGSEHVWGNEPPAPKVVGRKVSVLEASVVEPELVGLSFRMPSEFVREFKREALGRGMKLNELLVASFRALVGGS